MAKQRGVYARRTEVTKDEIRELRGDAFEFSTARKVGAGCDAFWQQRNLARTGKSGGWEYDGGEAPKRWVRKPQPPTESIRPKEPTETTYQEFKRLARERAEAEAIKRMEQQEYDKQWALDMEEIERERRDKARRAARPKE